MERKNSNIFRFRIGGKRIEKKTWLLTKKHLPLYKLTDLTLSQDILDILNLEEVEKFGGKKDKIIKKLNEHYQYHGKTFSTVNKGDLSLLCAVVVKYVHELKYL